MNSLKRWVKESREQERRSPERYIRYYPELVEDGANVLLTKELFKKIETNCGRYDGTFPTGTYLGKMFVRAGQGGDYLVWIGISKDHPMTRLEWKSRKIILVEG